MTNILIMCLVAAFAAGTGVWNIQNWRYAKIELERVEKEREMEILGRKRVFTAATAHETTKTIIDTKYVAITETIENVITKPIYINICFDDDGLRAHARAVELTGASPKPANAVSTPKPP